MSNEQAPECCPFCGATPKGNWTGRVQWFTCGTMVTSAINRNDQTRGCEMAERQRLTRERDELQAWKDSAMAVEREWDPNTLATMLGGRLGEAQRVVIQREVPKLLERVKRFEDQVSRLKAWGDALEDLAPQPPDRNCSCHLHPPCSDCVDWGEIREAKENWREAKEATP